MSNLVVVANKDIDKILEKDIKAVIIGVKNLSIYPFELDIESIINIANTTKKNVYIAINKMIHNSDLDYIKDILIKINNTKIKGIIFYDVGLINTIKDINIKKELVISLEHLNASVNSHLFYQKKGITSSFITSDITIDEIKEIKNNTKLNIFYTVYGYLPIFYSRRYLLTNYFKYINKDKKDNNYYIYYDDNKYMIVEKDYGTIIYSPLVNLINELDNLKILDNLVIDMSYNDNIDIIDDFLNNKKVNNSYKGFYDTKTIYKLRNDNNE